MTDEEAAKIRIANELYHLLGMHAERGDPTILNLGWDIVGIANRLVNELTQLREPLTQFESYIGEARPAALRRLLGELREWRGGARCAPPDCSAISASAAAPPDRGPTAAELATRERDATSRANALADRCQALEDTIAILHRSIGEERASSSVSARWGPVGTRLIAPGRGRRSGAAG